jgi:3-hydroxyisobutyrate dehydrogenase-like beta-hydroxyacid dehydrogenase
VIEHPASGRTVGAIGLGAMGAPMAGRLVAAGYDVVGFDVDSDRLSSFRATGRTAGSAVDVVRQADVILCSLPSVTALTSVVEAIEELRTGVTPVAGARPLTVVELSTLSLDARETARVRLAKVGADLLDCPVSGTAIQAAMGDLVVYASGDEAAVERVSHILAALGRSVHRLGAFGAGTRTKLVANLLVSVHIVAAAEAIGLARLAGLDVAAVLDAITDGAGTSRMLEVRGPMMVAEQFGSPSMTVRLFQKDVDLVEAFAADKRAPTPTFAAAAAVFRSALAEHSEEDTASVYLVLQR